MLSLDTQESFVREHDKSGFHPGIQLYLDSCFTHKQEIAEIQTISLFDINFAGFMDSFQ